MRRIAILISGGGSNMVALVRDMVGNHPARPVLVLSNEPDAGGLKRAREMDVESAVVITVRFEATGPHSSAQ